MANPTGGPQDAEAPQIKKSEPLNYSTNFEGNSIRLTFDEFVSLTNIKQEYLLSPPVKEDPKFKLKSKSLLITFQEELMDNTTYSLNLGEGVKDFHEGNPLDSNVFVFSTGDYVDSNRVRGLVKDAFDLSPIKKINVMLYRNLEDSVPAQKRPVYYSKTKESGDFDLNHLKEGEYQIFALEDKNSNSIYDLPNERIGFLERAIDSEKRDTNYSIYLFQEDLANQFVISAKEVRPGLLRIILNQESPGIDLSIIDTAIADPWLLKEISADGDTVDLWHQISDEGDKKFKLVIKEDTSILDTAKIKLKAFPQKEDELNKLKPKIIGNFTSGIAPYFENLRFRWTSPTDKFKENSITLINQKDTMNPGFSKSGDNNFEIDYALKEDQSYTLIIDKSSFTDILGFSNDSIIKTFKTKSSIEYATLKLRISGLQGESFFMEMWNSDDKLVKRVNFTDQREFEFINLSPSKYKIKLTYDDNRNNKWDPGTFIPRKLPEKVIYFSGEIEIKEGWDKELEWIISPGLTKEP